MRIAYIFFYQGPGLVKNRPCLHNLSLGSKVKGELVAELLQKSSHEVEIISPGEVDRYQFRFYRSFKETEPFHPDIPVYYASAVPIRFICGIYGGISTMRILRARHRVSPFDLVIIYNMKSPHIACARYAMCHLNLPVVLDYSDDAFVNIVGERHKGLKSMYHHYKCRNVMKRFSGCMAVTPYLLAQLPSSLPKLLFRAVVSSAIVDSSGSVKASRNNWVVYSGTHDAEQGLEQLVTAWQMLKLTDWELHIAGAGPKTPILQNLAEKNRTIVFHGLLNKEENARLLCAGRIGMNAQDVTLIPGTSFAWKIVEYLAAGLHVITTPRGTLEPQMEAGISYISDNAPARIAAILGQIIIERRYEHTAGRAALEAYGPATAARQLNDFLKQVISFKAERNGCRNHPQTLSSRKITK